ncbi:MAG: ABC transporter permease [Christensenellaceae bacterium]
MKETAPNKPLVNKKRSLFKGENGSVILIFILFVIGIIAFELITSVVAGEPTYPKFITPANWLNIIMQVSVVGIMAMGMGVVMIGGGIDLSVGMVVSFVALYVAKAYTDWHMPLPLAIITVIIFAVLMEGAMGFIISRLKVEPFIITLGGMICIKGIALVVSNSKEVTMTGALDWLKGNMVGEGIKDPISGLPLVVQTYVLVFIAATIIIWLVMKYTKYGRRVYAVGANKQAAYLAGINVKNVVMSTYLLNGLLVAIGGICLMARSNTAVITIGQSLEIDVIAAVVIGGVAMSGGKGNIWGVFIGVILMGAIANGMNILKIQADMQYIVKGLILIIVVSAGAFATTMQEKRILKQQREEFENQEKLGKESAK